MKYKVGDKVRIKSHDWYLNNKNKFGKVWTESLDGESPICFDSDMILYCGMEAVIFSVERENYVLKGIPYAWTDEMIEGLVEEEVGLVDELSSRWVNEFNLPEGYIFKDENGNVINANKIVLEKKKKEYPKTYEECAKLLNTYCGSNGGYNWKLLSYFQPLLICRDAYWKIAGEEMGLGKPWEPDWAMYSGLKYCIIYSDNEIKWRCKSFVTEAKIIAFPTAEMRDAFYENFKELIEMCKELL